MSLRRALGLLVTFTMAHLAVVGSDLVCAQHSSAQATHSDAAMPGMDHGQQADRSHGKQPCKTPSSEDCCQALASCSAPAAIASVVSRSNAPRTSSVALSSSEDIPLSRVAAPEPPPPKA